MELACFGFAFVVTLIVMSIFYYILIHSADKRLSKANEMVLTLAHSADRLAETISYLKDTIVYLEKQHKDHLKVVEDNRNELKDSYTKLLHKYEILEGRIIDNYEQEKNNAFEAIREMAKKPMIHNSNSAEK